MIAAMMRIGPWLRVRPSAGERPPATPFTSRTWALALLLAAAALAATAFPLLVYSTTLATFGLAHAVVELRVLDHRYRRSLPSLAVWVVGAALLCVFAVRVATNLGWVGRGLAHDLELASGCAAVVAMVPWCAARGPRHLVVAILVATLLVLGVLTDPLSTILVLAVLHNLAPWPLLVAVTATGARRQLVVGGAVVFVIVPLLIATGVPFDALHRLGIVAPEATALPTGPLFDHLGAFWGPAPDRHPAAALHVFSACAYLQCAHYLAVLVVLPRHGPVATQLAARAVLIPVVFGLVVAGAYAVDFAGARAWYGTIAGVHAWAEFPALLLALGAMLGARRAARLEVSQASAPA